MALPQFQMSHDSTLEPDDITDSVLDNLHGRDAEHMVWSAAVRQRFNERRADWNRNDRYKGGNDRPAASNSDDDADIFREVTR